mmetsp:Transcript_5453/g.15478  ORF Transcript_5453/g.15478 Transcript_5453/m.15478 type:complete len:289 (+) Transcript_5453:422-1288(+)
MELECMCTGFGYDIASCLLWCLCSTWYRRARAFSCGSVLVQRSPARSTHMMLGYIPPTSAATTSGHFALALESIRSRRNPLGSIPVVVSASPRSWRSRSASFIRSKTRPCLCAICRRWPMLRSSQSLSSSAQTRWSLQKPTVRTSSSRAACHSFLRASGAVWRGFLAARKPAMLRTSWGQPRRQPTMSILPILGWVGRAPRCLPSGESLSGASSSRAPMSRRQDSANWIAILAGGSGVLARKPSTSLIPLAQACRKRFSRGVRVISGGVVAASFSMSSSRRSRKHTPG